WRRATILAIACGLGSASVVPCQTGVPERVVACFESTGGALTLDALARTSLELIGDIAEFAPFLGDRATARLEFVRGLVASHARAPWRPLVEGLLSGTVRLFVVERGPTRRMAVVLAATFDDDRTAARHATTLKKLFRIETARRAATLVFDSDGDPANASLQLPTRRIWSVDESAHVHFAIDFEGNRIGARLARRTGPGAATVGAALAFAGLPKAIAASRGIEGAWTHGAAGIRLRLVVADAWRNLDAASKRLFAPSEREPRSAPLQLLPGDVLAVRSSRNLGAFVADHPSYALGGVHAAIQRGLSRLELLFRNQDLEKDVLPFLGSVFEARLRSRPSKNDESDEGDCGALPAWSLSARVLHERLRYVFDSVLQIAAAIAREPRERQGRARVRVEARARDDIHRSRWVADVQRGLPAPIEFQYFPAYARYGEVVCYGNVVEDCVARVRSRGGASRDVDADREESESSAQAPRVTIDSLRLSGRAAAAAFADARELVLLQLWLHRLPEDEADRIAVAIEKLLARWGRISIDLDHVGNDLELVLRREVER
ncbi:MAG: hypothetical protein KDC95_19845, partial [Planctomycetes bacterium]|nr:hypothetical protein [Planctomycetota bacterium]